MQQRALPQQQLSGGREGRRTLAGSRASASSSSSMWRPRAAAAPLLAAPGASRARTGARIGASRPVSAVAAASRPAALGNGGQQHRGHRRRHVGGDGEAMAAAAAGSGGGGNRGAAAAAAAAAAGRAAAAGAGAAGAGAGGNGSSGTTTNNPAAAAATTAAATPPRTTTADASTTAACLAAASSVDESLVKTRFIAETLLPTRHGAFRLRGYKHTVDGGSTFTEPAAVICGTVEGQSDVPVRVHDACFTSEVLGSLKCDCAEQLRLALDAIHAEPPGMVIYLQQEGRGIGLANKIAAYSLQERQGLDTVDANRALGLPDDCREYTSVRNILRDLGVKSVRLMTNNPRKMAVLAALGVEVTGRVPCVVQAGPLNRGYLDAKQRRMAHLLTHDEEGEDGEGEGERRGSAAVSGGVDEATAWAEAAAMASRSRDGGGGGDSEGDAAAAAAAAAAGGAESAPWCYWGHEGEPSQPISSDTAPGGGFASSPMPGARMVDEE
jgi:GTP cyclohydrolase II